MTLMNAKKTLPEIRTTIDRKYGTFGPSTPSLRPPA
jgi:hypothetical protein